MSKKDKPIRVKLIANPFAGDTLEAASKIEQVMHHLLEHGLEVDLALVKPKGEAMQIIGEKNLVAPDADMEDGLLDIDVYPNSSKAGLLAYFAKNSHEKNVPDGTIQRYRARKIEVKTSPKLDITAEGIILGKGSARIKILPGALRVLAPEPGPGAEKTKEEKPAQKLPEPVPA